MSTRHLLPSSSFQIPRALLVFESQQPVVCSTARPPFSSIPCAIHDSCVTPQLSRPVLLYKRGSPCLCPHPSTPAAFMYVGAAMASAPAATHSRDAGDDLYNDTVMLAAVISLSVVVFFVFFLHIYARWLIRRQRPVVRRVVVFREPLHLRSVATFPGHTTEIRLSISGGVDPKVVASLPVFVYKSREHHHGLDCVVCLSAMEEDDSARLLPACKHAFHVGCIDTWLMSHASCPICRAPVEIMASRLRWWTLFLRSFRWWWWRSVRRRCKSNRGTRTRSRRVWSMLQQRRVT